MLSMDGTRRPRAAEQTGTPCLTLTVVRSFICNPSTAQVPSRSEAQAVAAVGCAVDGVVLVAAEASAGEAAAAAAASAAGEEAAALGEAALVVVAVAVAALAAGEAVAVASAAAVVRPAGLHVAVASVVAAAGTRRWSLAGSGVRQSILSAFSPFPLPLHPRSSPHTRAFPRAVSLRPRLCFYSLYNDIRPRLNGHGHGHGWSRNSASRTLGGGGEARRDEQERGE